MVASRGRALFVAFLFAVVGLPSFFVLGAGATGLLHAMRGPPPGGGKGQIADAYTVISVGGPIGILVGILLVGWLSYRLGDRLTWPVVGAGLAAMGVASALSMYVIGSN